MNFIKGKAASGITKGLFMASGAVSPTEIAARCGYDWLLLGSVVNSFKSKRQYI